MAGDPLKKVQSGDPLRIPAEAYNAFIDAARLVRAAQPLPSESPPFTRQPTLAKVKNTTGSALARFAVLALDGPLITPSANEPEFLRQTTFVGVTPAAGDEGRFAVLLEPLAANKIGWGAIGGVVPVQLAIDPPTIHDRAEIVAGSSAQLANVPDGSAQVLWVEPTGGTTRWAVVRLSAGGGGAGADIKIVLIDADIDGITEADPQDFLTTADIPLGAGEEAWDVYLQDPPDDNFALNHVDQLNRWRYQRQQVALKYFEADGDGSALAYTVINDATNEQKIVRYATTDVWYDDGKPFLVGEYQRSDYPDFPENEAFPPAGLPEGFLKRRYRGIAINGVLVTALCKVLPPPELPS